MLCCYIQQPRLLRMLDYKIYDAMLHAVADGGVTPFPVIVDLDEASLEAYGQWPWPRFLLADLLYKLRQKGVAAVGVDILLAEEDRASPRKLQSDLKRFLDLNVSFAGLPGALQDYDKLLADSLDKKTVLSMYCRFAAKNNTPNASGAPAPDPVGSVIQKTPDARAVEMRISNTAAATLPLPEFWETSSVGMINMSPDADGVVRRLPLVGLYRDQMYASLGLRTLMAALGTQTLVSRIGPDGLESVRLGQTTIPVAPDGSFYVPYRGGTRTFPYYSAKDILTGAVPAEKLQGKLVFLGSSAPGLLDTRTSPLARVYPGVEVHATVADAILAQTFLRVPPWTPGLQALCIAVCAAISSLAFGLAKPRVYVPTGIFLLGGIVFASMQLFRNGFVVSPLYAAATVAILGTLLLLVRFRQEERQKTILRNTFSRYVAPDVVERIAKLDGDIFAGEEREMTIMFTDIRGFTTLSENLAPRQIVQLLNRYFTPMTALVRANKGTLDKFIGDALMAFWNAPVPVSGHPLKAVITALEMQEELKKLNNDLRAEFGRSIAMGVGVHTGKAYVGNMGSEELLNYTLIGDNVNLASRLEGLCPQFGVGIVVSAETKDQCGEALAFLPLDTVRVKGKEQPVSIFTAMRPEEWEKRNAELQEYIAALGVYASGNFAAARPLFAALSTRFPNDALYALYANRCALLPDTASPDWDGVWRLDSK